MKMKTKRGVHRVTAMLLSTWALALPAPADEGPEAPAVRVREWSPGGSASPSRDPSDPSSEPTIEVGMHYAMINSRRRAERVAGLLSETGVRTVKVFPDQVTWGQMQSSESSSVDFAPMDRFVLLYQAAGFRNLILTLKSHNPWASKQCERDGSCANPTPKPEYLDAYATWVQLVAERYDGDGRDDMPGLRSPVRWIEVGARFSHDEPEPADEYVEMLRVAYPAVRRASPDALVTHAGIHATTVFSGGRTPDDLEQAFASARRVIHHDLAAVRTLLDASDSFDLVNIHSMGDPYEIEAMIPWLKREMEQRGIEKPIVISDSAPSPFVAWGPATSCTMKPEDMGVVIYPATEQDRCRLANYFVRLTEREDLTIAWTQGHVAADLIKKVVLAAEQGVSLISVAYMQDVEGYTKKAAQARIGAAAWAGMIDLRRKERRPAFFALEQLHRHLQGYQKLKRISTPDDRIRIYRFDRPRGPMWIAWVEPIEFTLPGDPLVRLEIDLPVMASTVIVERMIDRTGMVNPAQQLVRRSQGFVTFPINQIPAFVLTGY